ncbi:MAG: DNA-3-methyladenine glycosylase [Planctomycetota bacterium]
MRPLPRAFFARSALVVARELLGAILVHRRGESLRCGVVVETEAYLGERDLASHASKGRTARTDVMFGPPGHAYVYLIYGMHHCMNVVCEREGTASAVLLRGLAPLRGIPPDIRTDGPGRLARALGITLAHNRLDLCAGQLTLAAGNRVAPRRVARGPRIGVDYAGAWAAKPYRFFVRGDPGVSAPRG